MTPLLAATLTWAAGLLAGLRWTPDVLTCAALLVAAALLLRRPRRGGPTGAPPRRAGVLLAFALAGAAVGGIRGDAVRTDCRARLGDGAVLSVRGVPTALPAAGAAVSFRGQGTCSGVIRLRPGESHLAALDSAARGWTPAVEVHGRWLAYPVRGGWPRAPLYTGSLVVDSVLPLPAAAGRAGAVTRFRVAQQARLRGLLPERWGLAEALLLAQKSGLDRETRTRFVAAGLVHLLAISGMHVGLIAAGVLLLAQAAGVPRRRGRRIAVVVTAAYVVFLGAPSAALRALLQATLLLASTELQRPAEPYTLLGTAALIILLLEPMALLDPGFQLSFAGMIGLIGWRRPILLLLPERLPRYVRDGIAAGIAASALTTPVAALHFGTASWIGVPGSLLAVPLLSAALAGLVLALLLALLTGSTTGVHGLLADVPLRLLELVAELCARVPGGHGYLSATTVLGFLAATALFILVRRAAAGQRRALRLGIAGAAAVALVAWAPALVRVGDGALVIHAIDVGQGDAFAIRTPAGRWVLVDAGPRTPFSDAGRDRVVPFLLRQGARRIEALILTHPDADHIGGALAVLDVFDVGLVIDPGLAAGKTMFIDLLAVARQGGQRWVAGRADVAFEIDGVRFDLLYPLSDFDATLTANDLSVVFRLQFGTFAALFLGDAPMEVEELLAARHGSRLRAAVLKVGHHGSTTSTGEVLLRTVRPEVALVSAGRRNRYGHPAPSVVRRLEEHQVRVLRTDVHGNITVRASRAGRVEVLAR
jgi:competence protein ComEC